MTDAVLADITKQKVLIDQIIYSNGKIKSLILFEGTRWQLYKQAKKSTCATKNIKKRILVTSWRYGWCKIPDLHDR